MLIDNLDLDNRGRLGVAAVALLEGNIVCVTIEAPNGFQETTYRNWLRRIFVETHKLDSLSAEILTWGATFQFTAGI